MEKREKNRSKTQKLSVRSVLPNTRLPIDSIKGNLCAAQNSLMATLTAAL